MTFGITVNTMSVCVEILFLGTHAMSIWFWSQDRVWHLSALLQWLLLGEKLGWVQQVTQSGWEVESEALFLGSSESIQFCWISVKGYHVRGPPIGNVCAMCIKFLLQDVHRFESSWLSDTSNRLSYGSQHVDNLMELMEGLSLICYDYLFANSWLA
jgi:hypothetical protein